ncbi:hypothetical protein SCUCBS95973_007064, partial [Sporothrix curviconia]
PGGRHLRPPRLHPGHHRRHAHRLGHLHGRAHQSVRRAAAGPRAAGRGRQRHQHLRAHDPRRPRVAQGVRPALDALCAHLGLLVQHRPRHRRLPDRGQLALGLCHQPARRRRRHHRRRPAAAQRPARPPAAARARWPRHFHAPRPLRGAHHHARLWRPAALPLGPGPGHPGADLGRQRVRLEHGARPGAARHRLCADGRLGRLRVPHDARPRHGARVPDAARHDALGAAQPARHWPAVLDQLWHWHGHVRQPVLYGPVLCAGRGQQLEQGRRLAAVLFAGARRRRLHGHVCLQRVAAPDHPPAAVWRHHGCRRRHRARLRRARRQHAPRLRHDGAVGPRRRHPHEPGLAARPRLFPRRHRRHQLHRRLCPALWWHRHADAHVHRLQQQGRLVQRPGHRAQRHHVGLYCRDPLYVGVRAADHPARQRLAPQGRLPRGRHQALPLEPALPQDPGAREARARRGRARRPRPARDRCPRRGECAGRGVAAGRADQRPRARPEAGAAAAAAVCV